MALHRAPDRAACMRRALSLFTRGTRWPAAAATRGLRCEYTRNSGGGRL